MAEELAHPEMVPPLRSTSFLILFGKLLWLEHRPDLSDVGYYPIPQPSPHFFSCDSKAVGLDAKSPRHLQREAGPTDRVIPRVT